jgi:uncharacterized membrane protein
VKSENYGVNAQFQITTLQPRARELKGGIFRGTLAGLVASASGSRRWLGLYNRPVGVLLCVLAAFIATNFRKV